jgi:hypothetical protein
VSNEPPPQDELTPLSKSELQSDQFSKKSFASLVAQLLPGVEMRGSRKANICARILEAGKQALLILEMQEFVDAAIQEYGDGELGLLRCRVAWKRRKPRRIAPDYKFKRDADGKLLAVPFEEGLKNLMPNDSVARRESYLRAWFFDDCIAQVTEEVAILEQRLDNTQRLDGTPLTIRDIRAHTGFFATLLARQRTLARLRKNSCALLRKITERRIREMKRSGIPESVFARAQRTFAAWKGNKPGST